MNPNEFTYELWGPNLGYGGCDVFDHDADKVLPGYRELGRCEAMQLKCRPRAGQAVMLWDELRKVQFWIHLPLSEVTHETT